MQTQHIPFLSRPFIDGWDVTEGSNDVTSMSVTISRKGATAQITFDQAIDPAYGDATFTITKGALAVNMTATVPYNQQGYNLAMNMCLDALNRWS